MTKSARQLLEDALTLPERERAELAARLIDSLDEESGENWETAWSQEIAHRIAELDTGAVEPVSWERARSMIFGQASDESSG